MSKAEELIRNNINFTVPSASWNRVFCAVCGDGTHEKGPRGGWKFSDDMAAYHCFNCGVKGTLDFTRDIPLSKDMYKILTAFGVSPAQFFPLIQEKSGKKERVERVKTPLNLAPIELPSHFHPLVECSSLIQDKCKKVLEDHAMGVDDYPFYYSMPVFEKNFKNYDDYLYYKSIADRLIIPVLYRNRPVFYEARRLNDSKKSAKYISCRGVKKSQIVYFPDRVKTRDESPLYITESFFDAYHLNGIATMRNDMSQDLIDYLNDIGRTKVVVPDKFGDSNRLAEIAIENGWGVSILRYSECKDVSENIKKYGILLTCKNIYESIAYGKSAELLLKTL